MPCDLLQEIVLWRKAEKVPRKGVHQSATEMGTRRLETSYNPHSISSEAPPAEPTPPPVPSTDSTAHNGSAVEDLDRKLAGDEESESATGGDPLVS